MPTAAGAQNSESTAAAQSASTKEQQCEDQEGHTSEPELEQAAALPAVEPRPSEPAPEPGTPDAFSPRFYLAGTTESGSLPAADQLGPAVAAEPDDVAGFTAADLTGHENGRDFLNAAASPRRKSSAPAAARVNDEDSESDVLAAFLADTPDLPITRKLDSWIEQKFGMMSDETRDLQVAADLPASPCPLKPLPPPHH